MEKETCFIILLIPTIMCRVEKKRKMEMGQEDKTEQEVKKKDAVTQTC